MTAAHEAAGAIAAEEAILQSYLFLGFPAALQALKVWREHYPRATEAETPDYALWRSRGEAVCERVYGRQYNRLRENVSALHPDLEQWMLTEGYGKVLARPGLDLRARELCIVALLTVQDAPHQLYSHVRGALNCGAAATDVRAAITIAGAYTSQQRATQALQVWDAVNRP